MLTSHRQHVHVEVAPPSPVPVEGEAHPSLPLYDVGVAGWLRGAKLGRLVAQETTTPGLLDPDTLVVRTVGGQRLRRGEDWECDETWGTLGRLPRGRLSAGQPVLLEYTFTPLRLDSVVLTSARTIELRQGEPYGAAPPQPPLAEGEQRLLNIWLPGRAALGGLTEASLLPVLDGEQKDHLVGRSDNAGQATPLLPRTLAKLRRGEPLNIVAWGDSVTDGSYLDDQSSRWQEQFVGRLRALYPAHSAINLRTQAGGGRSTRSYMEEPPESARHFPACVLGAYSSGDGGGGGSGGSTVDLVISEFVNDAGYDHTAVEQRYGAIHRAFEAVVSAVTAHSKGSKRRWAGRTDAGGWLLRAGH
jgi:hypothetical protein